MNWKIVYVGIDTLYQALPALVKAGCRVCEIVSCPVDNETEFNLPGEWYTNEEIDYGAYTWGRGTVMTFNARNQGTIGSIGDPNYLLLSGSGLMEDIIQWNCIFMVMALMLTFGERKLPAGHLVEHGIIHGKISGIG